MKLIRPDNSPIEKWEDWARPKREYQWKCGRSAMELAKAWFRDGRIAVPKELIELLAGHQRLSCLEFISGIPEKVTPLPERGEGRNHDLWLLCRTPFEKVTVCIEAKVDEPFGNYTVAEYWSLTVKRQQKGNRTKAPERIKKLLSLVGTEIDDPTTSSWADIKYQLLTAICGTAIQAKADSSTLGVLVVYELQTNSTERDKLDKNMRAYELFLQTVFNDPEIVIESGRLYGPVTVDGVNCLIGKATWIAQQQGDLDAGKRWCLD